MRSEITCRRRVKVKSPDSFNSKMAANCCGTSPASIARNAKSAELARSITGCFPLRGPTRQRSRVIDPTCLSDRVIGQHGRAQGHADIRTTARLMHSGEYAYEDGVGA